MSNIDRKNSNVTPTDRHYICYNRRKVKKSIEMIKRFKGTTRKLSVALRSAAAYFAGGKPTNKTEE